MTSNGLVLSYDSENVFGLDVVVGLTKDSISLYRGKSLDINEKNVKQDLLEQPGKFAWYAALLADQEFRMAKSERDLKRRQADISMQLRQGKLKIKTEAGDVVKLTEAAIADYVSQDAKIRALEDELHDLESIVKKIKALVSASLQRKDVLIELSRLELQEKRQFGFTQQ